MEDQTRTASLSDESIAPSSAMESDNIFSSSIVSTQQKQTYYQSWLETQCELIDGAQSALLLMPLDDSLIYQPVAIWPVEPAFIAELTGLVEQVINEGSALVTALNSVSQGQELFAIAYPIYSEDELTAVVTVALHISAQEQLQKAMQVLQLSATGIELLSVKAKLVNAGDNQLRMESSVDLLASVMSEPDYASAAMRLVTELAVQLNCDRVCLGTYKRNKSKIEHLSHSTQFGKRMNLVRCIEEVMDEAIDQKQSIRFPLVDLSGGIIVQAHQQLSQEQGDACVLSVPLYVNAEIKGALTLERNPDLPFTNEEIELSESVVALVIPALEDKRLNDRPVIVKVLESLGNQLSKLFGAGYLGRKLLLIGLSVLMLFLSFAIGPYRLSADARLDSYIQRVVAAPYDGYIHSAVYRSGDVVSKGQVLVSLDDRDLHLEKLKWFSEQAKLNRQYQEALAVHDRAKINIINAQQDQVTAQLQLVQSQLDRAELLAPFDGLIVGGDLSQRLGGSVEKGEVLFEVSPLHFYRINLLIKESRIADLKIGQDGSLHLSALPEKPFKFVVTKITPLTESKDGATYFTVEAALQGESDQLQPGMEGIGKIYIDDRKLISIWTRELNEWLRLKVWSWWS